MSISIDTERQRSQKCELNERNLSIQKFNDTTIMLLDSSSSRKMLQMEITNEQIQSLTKFALKVLEDWPDMGYLDGGDLQDMAVASNLLIPHIVHSPCGEDCYCSEYYGDDEWEDGVTCYRVVDWLDRVAEQRNEAVEAGQKSPSCPPTQHKWKEEYYGYKCEVCETFVPYGSEPWLPVDE